jgi:hypothetical protein
MKWSKYDDGYLAYGQVRTKLKLTMKGMKFFSS